MICWLLSQKSPLFVFMSPGSPEALRDQDSTGLLAGPRGFIMASSTSSSHKGWEPDAWFCASVSLSAKHGKAGGGGGRCWAGAEGGAEAAGPGSFRTPALQPSPSLPFGWASLPPCLCPRGTESGPRFISTFYFQRCCKPPALPTWEKGIPCPQQLQRDREGMEQESTERPSATRHRQLPGRNPDDRNVAANRSACFYQSAQRDCTKGGAYSRASPFPLPGHPCAHHFLPQFPQQDDEQHQPRTSEARSLAGAALSPQHVASARTQKRAGQVSSHRTGGCSPSSPQPRPLELLNHVLGRGCRLPAPPGLPAASTHDPLLPAADASWETQTGERRPPVLPTPARSALLSPGASFPGELRLGSSELGAGGAGLRAAA